MWVKEGTHAKIARVGGRTTTLDAVDDLPHRILGGLLVGRQGNLAGAAAMRSLASEAKGLRLADGHDILLDQLVDVVALLAGEVATIGEERVGVDMIGAVRDRRLHDDMAMCDADDCRDQRRELEV